jgi:hypothetical protein
MNPLLSEAMIERQMAEDREGGLAEWGGLFRSDVAGHLLPEWIDRVTIPSRFELPPQANFYYRAFTDVSGGARDSYTLSISHLEQKEDGPVIVQDLLRIRRAPHDPHQVTREYSELLKEYRCLEVCGDKYSAQWSVQAFAEHGITYKQAELTASEIYLYVEALFARGQLELLDNSTLAHELKNLERRTRQGGRDQVTHGSPHDDAANATCGSLWLLDKQPVIGEGRVDVALSHSLKWTGAASVQSALDVLGLPGSQGDGGGDW